MINATGPRVSQDIDIFHDEEKDVQATADADAAVLASHGYKIAWERHGSSMCTAIVTKDAEGTKLDWAHNSAFRFFPAQRDATFGYKLHPIDIATNKALAAADRRAVRDVADLVEIHRSGLQLSVVIWAAVAKDPGYSPEFLIAQIRRNAHYARAEFDVLESDDPDPAILLREFRAALDAAEAFASRMPTNLAGLLFLEDGNIVQPDPDRLGEYETRAASKGGILPTPG